MVNAEETRYYSFWLTADNTVADFWSSTDEPTPNGGID